MKKLTIALLAGLTLAACSESSVEPMVSLDDDLTTTTGPVDSSLPLIGASTLPFAPPAVAATLLPGDPPQLEAMIREYAGLQWVWASPCDGGCSQIIQPIPFGFRFATPAEMTNYPPLSIWGTYDGGNGMLEPSNTWCAAVFFDPYYSHCDAVNYYQGRVSSAPTGSYGETVLVREIPVADSDGDGVPDDEDAFPNSNLEFSVSVGECDSGVENQSFGDGSTMSDRIGEARDGARNHGQFVSAVAALAGSWKKDGLISGRDQGKITSCAARSR